MGESSRCRVATAVWLPDSGFKTAYRKHTTPAEKVEAMAQFETFESRKSEIRLQIVH